MFLSPLLSALVGGLSVASAVVSSSIPVNTVRGVNLGGLFISEPWMMAQEWANMGCDRQNSEFDCMMNNQTAQSGFTSHYRDWITRDDLVKIVGMGLNTIRIPLGYWIVESTVDRSSEYFPTGGFHYLRRLCGWAAEEGLHVILDFHGAPGAQTTDNPFTGQYADTPGFYTTYNYERSYEWFKNITTEVHTDRKSFSSVFAIEVLNEPVQGYSAVGSLVSEFYPGALSAIRDAEQALGISCKSSGSSGSRHARRNERAWRHLGTRSSAKVASQDCLAVQFMDNNWGAGDAQYSLSSTRNVIYDGHDYVKWSSADVSRDGYMWFVCSENPSSQASTPVIVGEWSLGVSDDDYVWELSDEPDDAATWFNQFASAQMRQYEKGAGWIFWTWKTDSLDAPAWDYQIAVAQGYLPKNASHSSSWACDGYT